MRSIEDKFKKIRKFGFLNTFFCLQRRLKLSVLRLYFGFKYWHVDSNYRCRFYKYKVVDALDDISCNGVVEIGCGLGDVGIILRKKNSMIEYCGFDVKANVISAAKYLSRKNNNKFSIGSFESMSTLDGSYNTLLMLNLLDRFDPQILVELILSNITINTRYIVMDVIHIDAGEQYQNKHSAKKLIDLGIPYKINKIIKNIDKYRDLLILETVRLDS